MGQNRTTTKANIIAKNVPTVSNAILTDMLNADMSDNIRFRLDDAQIQSSSVDAVAINFTGKDRVDLTRTGGNISITPSGLEDGDVKYILITKTSGNTVSFVGVTDVTPVKTYVTNATSVLYEITRKGSTYLARAFLETVQTASETIEGVLRVASPSEANALALTNRIVTPGRMPISSDTQRGISQRATTIEHGALAATDKYCVPGRLPTMSQSQRGLARWASASELNSGVDTYFSQSLVVRPSELLRKIAELSVLATWINATPSINWTGAVSTLSYYKSPTNVVHIACNNLERRTADLTTKYGELLMTMPVGYRPTRGVLVNGRILNTAAFDSAFMHAKLEANGELDIYPGVSVVNIGELISFYMTYQL